MTASAADEDETRDEDEDHAEYAPRDTHRKKSKTTQDSVESDIVEAITDLYGGTSHKPAHKPDDKSNKSPHVGKGVLKVVCQICTGPIAVKVSTDL